MSDDQFEQQFQKFFRAFSERLTETETTIKADIADLREEIHNGNDQLAARLDTDDSERVALSGQVDRHDVWIHQLADKTDTDLAAAS